MGGGGINLIGFLSKRIFSIIISFGILIKKQIAIYL